MGLTDGQTIAGVGGGGGCGRGGGGGGKVWLAAAVSASRGGPEKVELMLGVALMACALPINHCLNDKMVSREQ